MTEGMAALLLGILAIFYAIISTTSTKKIIENINKFLERMKQEDIETEKRHREMLAEWRREHEEMLERMDRRHEETMNRIAQLITAKSEEIKELIKT